MSIHVFNNFNNCFLAGKLPAKISTRFIPVNTKFSELASSEDFYKLRNMQDLDAFASMNRSTTAMWDTDKFTHEDYSLTGTYYNYICKKVENIENNTKPDYITSDNFAIFLRVNNIPDDKELVKRLTEYAKTGFYYIKTREALQWVAERVNAEHNFNNFINIVLGDDIGAADADEPFTLPIIGSAERPYQGTFDGTGHKLINVTLAATKIANGLIGFLGDKGKLCNLQLGDANTTTTVVCYKKINLTHLKLSAANVNTGVLVGENYGTVENVAVFGKFIFEKFEPAIYAVDNTSEDNTALYETDPFDTEAEASNKFFNTSMCWNSPFNIVPYAGYFMQGIPFNTNSTDIMRNRHIGLFVIRAIC